MQQKSSCGISGAKCDDRRGAMLALVGVTIVALLGSMALVLDVGAGQRKRRVAQTAADAGAVGWGIVASW